MSDKITVLGHTFNSEEERRQYFREELRIKLPELKQTEGFPIGEDDNIINLSDPPYYTACPNPWLNDFIVEWEEGKKILEKQGKRKADFDVDSPYANDISEGKNNPFYTLHTYHTKVPHPAIMRYLLHYTEPGDIVFDGFAGTGMTGVAAKQCEKADSSLKFRLTQEYKEKHGCEPKWGERHAIMSDLAPAATFISANLNSDYKTDEVKKSITKKIDALYEKNKWMYETKHTEGSIGKISFVVWSEVASCPECSHEFVLWDVMADTTVGRMKKEFNCPSCSTLLSKKKCQTILVSEFDNILNEVVKSKRYIPVLIKYSINGKLFFKNADSDDIFLSEKINEISINNWVPISRLPEGDESRRNDKYGMTHIHQFYTKRNLIFMSELWKQFNLQEKFIATSILSRNLTKLNRYVLKPRTPHGEVNGPLSGTLYVSSEFVEQNPFDLLKSKIPKFKWDNSGILTSTNAAQENLIKDDSIDYIFTDPPFGANIMYSELNFIWESWLSVFTVNNKEAIENSTQNKSTLEYQKLMLECFKDYYRILKPGKWMTVEFSNTRAAVWNGIQTALTNSGFVICNISALDKKHGGIKSMTYSTAVKQDLIISCYKPSSEFDESFKQHKHLETGIWDFVSEHLNHLPVHIKKNNATTAIIERSPKILFDRLISFYVQKGLPVPIDARKFQEGLKQKHIERDGMFFSSNEVQKYDKLKSDIPEFVQMSLFVTNEQESIYWLRNVLDEDPKTEQDLYPLWMKDVASNMRKGDVLPEMRVVLEQNFLKDELGKWYTPDPENEADLEKTRIKQLLKLFDTYKEEAIKPKTKKIKEVRVEALRVGFRQCYQDKDFISIVIIGDKIPNNLLMEDEVLLQFYDIAGSRV